MQTITLKYENPDYPQHGFLFWEMVEKFMADKRDNESLGAIRRDLKILWSHGHANEIQGFVDENLELDQKHGIIKVVI